MIAAQQYYIEYNTELSSERLLNLLPNYIPDYCLTGDKPVEYWHQLITQAFRKVCWTGNMLHVQIRTLYRVNIEIITNFEPHMVK